MHYAEPHLRDLIIAAVETGLRKGELLALRWTDVTLTKQHGRTQVRFLVRAETSKTDTERPVSSYAARLLAVLRRRRLGPDGRDLPGTAFVFGNEVGEPIDSAKTAWNATCRRAGIVDLHFHDLRRECGSRWLEGGVGLLTVSAQLGHKRVTTTDTYLASLPKTREDEMADYGKQQNRRKPLAKLWQPAPAKPSGSAKAKTAVH